MDNILRKKTVMEILKVSDNFLSRAEKAGKFPKRIQLGDCSVGWLESEINEYFERKKAERDEPAKPRKAPGQRRPE